MSSTAELAAQAALQATQNFFERRRQAEERRQQLELGLKAIILNALAKGKPENAELIARLAPEITGMPLSQNVASALDAFRRQREVERQAAAGALNKFISGGQLSGEELLSFGAIPEARTALETMLGVQKTSAEIDELQSKVRKREADAENARQQLGIERQKLGLRAKEIAAGLEKARITAAGTIQAARIRGQSAERAALINARSRIAAAGAAQEGQLDAAEFKQNLERADKFVEDAAKARRMVATTETALRNLEKAKPVVGKTFKEGANKLRLIFSSVFGGEAARKMLADEAAFNASLNQVIFLAADEANLKPMTELDIERVEKAVADASLPERAEMVLKTVQAGAKTREIINVGLAEVYRNSRKDTQAPIRVEKKLVNTSLFKTVRLRSGLIKVLYFNDYASSKFKQGLTFEQVLDAWNSAPDEIAE